MSSQGMAQPAKLGLPPRPKPRARLHTRLGVVREVRRTPSVPPPSVNRLDTRAGFDRNPEGIYLEDALTGQVVEFTGR